MGKQPTQGREGGGGVAIILVDSWYTKWELNGFTLKLELELVELGMCSAFAN